MTLILERPVQQKKNIVLEYCLYARKSSEEEERQARSIESQVTEMSIMAEVFNLDIKEIYRESHSAKLSGKRPFYNKMIEDITNGKFNAIITWAPDRLARNAGDLGAIVDLMDRGLLEEIRTQGQTFTNNPNDKFLLMILGSQAKLENDNRGLNVKRGLRTKCKMGIRPGCVPLGYKLIRGESFGESSQISIDKERAPFIRKMFEYVVNSNFSGRQVHNYMIDEGFRTKKDKIIPLSMIYRIFKETFYYGEFEYPRGSGNWYIGSHTPIITKEIYIQAKKNLETYNKAKWGSKMFYFNKIFKCGHCGSGISGEERINRHGKRYVYYKCNKYGGNKICRSKYIREEHLVESIAKIVDSIKEDNFKLNKKILREVDKFNTLKKITSQSNTIKEISTNEYIQYILTIGTYAERKQILDSINGQLILKNGEVGIRKNLNIP